MIILLLVSQSEGPWPQYGADPGNSHTQLMRGAMFSTPVVKWTTNSWSEFPNEAYSVAVWDVDGDGQLEVLYVPYAMNPAMDSLYSRDGSTGAREWAYRTYMSSASGLCIADVDGDGQVEALVATTSVESLFCVNGSTGTLEWAFPKIYGEAVCPVAADVDSDGQVEVVIADGAKVGSDSVYCLNGATGTRKWAIQVPGGAVAGSPAVGDLDGDPALEIVLAVKSTTGDLCCLDGATGAIQWSKDVGHDGGKLTFDPSPCIADVDGDGNMEVISGGDALYCKDGATGVNKWRVLGNLADSWSSPAIGDVDGDGDLEVVVGSSGGRVRCRNGVDGTAIWGTSIPAEIHRGLTLVDMNLDNILDVLTSNAGGPVHCLNGLNGTVMWTVLSGDCHNNVVADVDGDTCVELIVGTSSGLYVLDDAGGATGCEMRPVYEGNEENQHTDDPREITLSTRGTAVHVIVPEGLPARIDLFDPTGRLVETLFSGVLTEGKWVFVPKMERRGVFLAVLRYPGGTRKAVLLGVKDQQ